MSTLKPLAPLKTLQETMDDYIKNDKMRELIMEVLACLKENNKNPMRVPKVLNRKADSTLVDVSIGYDSRANIQLYNDEFVVGYDIPQIQFAEPFIYKAADIDPTAADIARFLLGANNVLV